MLQITIRERTASRHVQLQKVYPTKQNEAPGMYAWVYLSHLHLYVSLSPYLSVPLPPIVFVSIPNTNMSLPLHLCFLLAQGGVTGRGGPGSRWLISFDPQGQVAWWTTDS